MIQFIKKDKSYYPQVFLEECKYVVKEKQTSKFITDYTEFYSDDDSDREILMKKILMTKIKYRNFFGKISNFF